MSLVRIFLLHFDTLQVDCDDYSDPYVRHGDGGWQQMDGWMTWTLALSCTGRPLTMSLLLECFSYLVLSSPC